MFVRAAFLLDQGIKVEDTIGKRGRGENLEKMNERSEWEGLRGWMER